MLNYLQPGMPDEQTTSAVLFSLEQVHQPIRCFDFHVWAGVREGGVCNGAEIPGPSEAGG